MVSEQDKRELESLKRTANEGLKIAKVILLAIIVGSCVFGALRQIPTLVSPSGAALEKVLDQMEDATEVKLVEPVRKSTSSKKGK